MRASLFVVYALVATLMPALVVGWNMGAMAPFWFLAGDAYLYLGIGEASSGLTMSFDGLRATNGFHPAWQIWVRIATALTGSPLGAMTLVAWSAIALTAAGVILLGLAIRRFTGSWVLAMLAVPGVYYLVIGQALANLPVWGFFDGMEAGLAFFLSGLLVFLIAQVAEREHDARYWLTLGLVIAALVFTRLDEVFVPFSLALALVFWPGRPLLARLNAAALAVMPTAIVLALFVAWSLWSTGLPAPVSGAAKGEGALLSNAWVTLATFFAPLIDLREGVTAYAADRAGLYGGAFRVVELIVPAAFALGFLAALIRRFHRQPWAPLLASLCGGVLIKATYNLLKVNYWHQASWYFALAMALMTLGAAILLAPAFRRLAERRAGPALAAVVLGSLAMLHASLWTNRLMTDPLRPEQRDFWLDRETMQATLLTANPEMRILEFGDGMINFTFDMPVRHGFVFAGDAHSLEALREGRLLAASVADGFDVLSSYEYLRVPDGAEDWDSDRIRAFLLTSFLDDRIKPELDAFDFRMLLVHRPTGVPFIRLIPRG